MERSEQTKRISGIYGQVLKQLDPGVITQSSEGLNSTYNPTFMKWLKPSFNYTANYRWSNDLTREGQNISTQLRFGSNFNLNPVQIVESLYKPPSKAKSRSAGRSRGSRSRNRNNSKVEKKKESNKTGLNPLKYVHTLFKK